VQSLVLGSVLFAETRFDETVKQIERELGRELTAREKFYFALSEACNSSRCLDQFESPNPSKRKNPTDCQEAA
jgi:hypothetical protein